jgi:hypothetical protein
VIGTSLNTGKFKCRLLLKVILPPTVPSDNDMPLPCKEAKLLIAGYTKIRRQRMIQLDKNPFLREDSDYFHYRKR